MKAVRTWFLRLSPWTLAALALYAAVWHTWGLLFGLGVHPYPAGTPWTYQLWSGFVPSLTVLSLLGTLASLYHLKNCHAEGCWRLGKHHVNGTPYCRHHEHLARPERSTEDLLTELLQVQKEVLAEVRQLRQAAAPGPFLPPDGTLRQ